MPHPRIPYYAGMHNDSRGAHQRVIERQHDNLFGACYFTPGSRADFSALADRRINAPYQRRYYP